MSSFKAENLKNFEGTLFEALGIEVTQWDPHEVRATMPVDRRTVQRFGILHGGASAALAESVASVGATLNIDLEKEFAVGVELNANHLKAVREGTVSATAKPVRVGRSIQVWNIEIHDEAGDLVCVSRCTLAVRPKRKIV